MIIVHFNLHKTKLKNNDDDTGDYDDYDVYDSKNNDK
jgi:hypothetical protein